jgi:hypothetical protein
MFYLWYVGSGQELKHMEKGKIEIPLDVFFSPARRAFDRRFS